MHFSLPPRTDTALLLSLLLAPLSVSAMLRCEHIRVGDADFNLSKLKGPHSVVTSTWHPPSHTNTSYTLDICAPLQRKGDVKKGDECPNGTRVCAIERYIRDEDQKHDDIERVIPIAGDLKNWGGGNLDAKTERLKGSDSHADADKEGLRLILKGGRYPLHDKKARAQTAIIEFLCDREKTGLEGETSPEDLYDTPARLRVREDKNEDDKKGDDKKGDDKKGDDTKEGEGDEQDGSEKQILKLGAALIWESYGPSDKGDIDVLRLTWRTQWACEDSFKNPPKGGNGGDDEESPSAGWGFFTWFVIIMFLGIAAYLIFGSWLNYNRYGARGWDLLPHGDTIRDVPYLLKDWARSVLNTVQGSGTRGGYSAL